MGVAVAMAVFALIVIAGSVQVGIGWGAEGPKAGFFPFYVGLVILGSSIINFGAVWSERRNAHLSPNGDSWRRSCRCWSRPRSMSR